MADIPGNAPVKKEFLKLSIKATSSEEQRNEQGCNLLSHVQAPVELLPGSFKKRPRDAAEDPSNLICRSLVSGNECSFGEKCKFSHDIMDCLKRKEKDIGDVCPVYNAFGFCKYGVNCRFASAHIDLKTGKNLKAAEVKPENQTNNLTVELRKKLRQREHPFFTLPDKRSKKNESELISQEFKKLLENKENNNGFPIAEKKIIDFRGKVYVAPLTTVGNLPFRRIMKQFGADITCGEMALASNLLQGQPSEWALLKRHESEDIFGVQVAGGFKDQMSRTSELIARELEVDFIDINMGCPIDLVCNAGAGSSLMKNTKKLEEVIRASLTGIELGSIGKKFMPALTIKMRIGWDHKKPNAHELVPIVQKLRGGSEFMNKSLIDQYTLSNQLGVSAFAIHGRSRLMRYTKTADWDYIFNASDQRDPEIEQQSHMAFIGNGDVLSYEEFHQHLENGKLDTCMLARGALIKPWLCTEIKEKRHWDISANERLDILKDFVKFGLTHWGSDQKGVNNTRRFLLEWLSFLCRYIPVGLLERLPQHLNDRPPAYLGRNDLETLFASDQAVDWIKISEMLLGPVPEGFKFAPKHKANAYAA